MQVYGHTEPVSSVSDRAYRKLLKHTFLFQGSPQNPMRYKIICRFDVNKYHMQVFLYTPVFSAQLAHCKNGVYCSSIRLKPKLVLCYSTLFSYSYFNYFLPHFLSMCHECNASILVAFLNIALIFENRHLDYYCTIRQGQPLHATAYQRTNSATLTHISKPSKPQSVFHISQF